MIALRRDAGAMAAIRTLRLGLDPAPYRHLARPRFWVAVAHKFFADRCTDLAAQVSYFFLLAFVPFLTFLAALIGMVPIGPAMLNRILQGLYEALPGRAYDLVKDLLTSLVRS